MRQQTPSREVSREHRYPAQIGGAARARRSFDVHGAHPRGQARGFTLVEIAIALALLAIALAAVSRATQTGVDTQRALRERTLAQWVAENRVAQRLSAQNWIAPGAYTGTEVQAGIEFHWREHVSETPNPALRRLDVNVAGAADPGRELAAMVGFIALERDR
jgi:general secretion pathway protein I